MIFFSEKMHPNKLKSTDLTVKGVKRNVAMKQK